MNTTIPDFTDAELKLVSASLFERYGKLVPVQLADSELQLDALSEELTLCPTIYWAERGAQFVVCKVAPDRYRCQFFYSETEQYGTGHDEYNSLGDCVLILLQVHNQITNGNWRILQLVPRRPTQMQNMMARW